jgi:hypothetical protein
MNKSVASKIVWLIPLACAPAACSTDGPIDIGRDVAELSDYAANWDGYGEAASFPDSGSDRVRLVLHANGEGTLELGDAPPLPPPTQAEGGYLTNEGTGGVAGTADSFQDGFKYPVHEARVEAGRIRFGIDPLDLYGAWCALVPPVPSDFAPSGYACGSSAGGTSSDPDTPDVPEMCFFDFRTSDPSAPESHAVDCGIYRMCIFGGPCTCTASACGPHVTPSDGMSLDNYVVVVDAAIDSTGTALTGTMAIKEGGTTNRITIRMQRGP